MQLHGGDAGRLVVSEEELQQLAEEELKRLDTSNLSAEDQARLKAKHLMFEEVKKQVVERPNDAIDVLRSWMAAD